MPGAAASTVSWAQLDRSRLAQSQTRHPLRYDAQARLQPWLATDVRAVNPTTWEITIREGVKFHDGTPFTVEDVKFNFDRVGAGSTLRYAPLWRQVDRTEIVDQRRVRVITKAPFPVFLNQLPDLEMVSKAYFDRVGRDRASTNPIGTGPYRFVRWLRDEFDPRSR